MPPRFRPPREVAVAEQRDIRDAKDRFAANLVRNGMRPEVAEKKAKEVAQKHDNKQSR
jgi:hypothetical protein